MNFVWPDNSGVMRFLSIAEAANALQLTPRQLRYLGVGARTSADGCRLYDAEGLTLLSLFARVAARFEDWGLPAWRARAAILYLEPGIRAALRRRAPGVLVLDPFRGLVRLSSAAPTSTAQVIAIRPVYVAMRQVIALERAERPELWTGREFTSEPELLTV